MHPQPRSLLATSRRAPGELLIAAGLFGAATLMPLVFVPQLYDDFTLAKQSVLLASAAAILAGLAIDGQFLPSNTWLRTALLAWTGWLTVAWLASIDRRGSMLGYYQYRQGYLTQLAYIVLFLGAFSLARKRAAAWLMPAALAGVSGALVYTAIQSLGRDPIDWWIDSSARAIGTIGNANELAAYALIGLAVTGMPVRFGPRAAFATIALVSAVTAFIIIQAESRSGLAALALAIALYPVMAAVQKLARRTIAAHFVALAVGPCCALLLSMLAGTAASTANRVASGVSQADTSASTRVAFWEGALPVIKASPVWGFGPDSLHLAFAQHRPAGLAGVFKDYDLIAQSSHNWLLDTAANTGIVGLAALLALLGTVAVRSLRAEIGQHDDGIALQWSVMLAYCGLTLLNPASIAAQALFFILLGQLAGKEEVTATEPAVKSRGVARLLLVAPACAALLAIAAILPVADLRAEGAWAAYARGDFRDAAIRYGEAARLLPIERTYRVREANAWLAAGAAGDSPALRTAEEKLLKFDDTFGFGFYEASALATARIGLGSPASQIMPVIARALQLNPNGLGAASYAATLRAAARSGGVLEHSQEDRRVYVIPLSWAEEP